MHYVRCLRPPKVTASGRSHQIELLFILSTDLGDSLLYPDEPIDLLVTAYVHGSPEVVPAPLCAKGDVTWKPGQRVVKQAFRAPAVVSRALASGKKVEVCISPAAQCAADGAGRILDTDATEGLIMPLWVLLNPQNERDGEVSTRRLQMHSGADGPVRLEIGEDIGEPRSLARHVWDGGVVTVCGLAGTIHNPVPGPSQGPCLQIVKGILSREGPVRVLELGCGVGVLGLGAATVASSMCPGSQGERTILMTDLADAEEQVRENMARVGRVEGVQLLYENLDWEDGRRGRFGPVAASQPWDLVMFSDCTYNVDVLPALVETLSAIHAANVTRSQEAGQTTTKVFLATKPRHSSESAVFDLINRHHWAKVAEQMIPLPVMGSEAQCVELYVFEKKA